MKGKKEERFVAMSMPNLAFTKGIILSNDTNIEESLDNKDLFQTGWQKINGTKVVTSIVIEADYDSSEELDDEGEPLTTVEDRMIGHEKRVIDSTVEYPVGTKLVWTHELGYMPTLKGITTPDEIIEKLEIIRDTFKEKEDDTRGK